MECGMYSCLLTCDTQYAEGLEIEINDQAGSVSVAQAHLAPVTSQDDVEACMATLLQHNKIRSATHNILAYRIYVEEREAWLQVNCSCTWYVYTAHVVKLQLPESCSMQWGVCFGTQYRCLISLCSLIISNAAA